MPFIRNPHFKTFIFRILRGKLVFTRSHYITEVAPKENKENLNETGIKSGKGDII